VPAVMRRSAWQRAPGIVRTESNPYFASVTLIGSGVTAGAPDTPGGVAPAFGLVSGEAPGGGAQDTSSSANSPDTSMGRRELRLYIGNSG
jgi:hypothetical protein